MRKDRLNFWKMRRSDYLCSKENHIDEGTNHISIWKSKTKSVIHKESLLEIASEVQIFQWRKEEAVLTMRSAASAGQHLGLLLLGICPLVWDAWRYITQHQHGELG